MIDVNKLKGAIRAKGLTQAEFAQKIGICEQTLSRKLNKGVFDSNEMQAMIDILQIDDPCSIFFAQQVAR